MRPGLLSRSIRLLAVLLLAALLGACGYKSRPLPLEKPLPVAPPQLQARQLGAEVLVSWTIPELNQDGTPATDLTGFNLYKLPFDPLDNCPSCLDRSVLLQRIELDYPVNARVIEQQVYVYDPEVSVGSGYQYQVAAYTAAGHEGNRAKARLVLGEPLPLDTELAATGHDKMVRLSWQPVTAPEGSKLIGYQLYRGVDDEAVVPAPINPKPLQTPGFDDYGVDNGKSYHYQLRVLIQLGETRQESLASAKATAIPLPGK